MGVATAKFRGGDRGVPAALVGYECEFGHTHPNESTARNCNADVFAKDQRDKMDEETKHRVRMIQADAGYKQALVNAKALGAADDDSAEEAVLRNGIDAINSVRAAVAALSIRTVPIPPEKPAGKPADNKTPDGKPGDLTQGKTT